MSKYILSTIFVDRFTIEVWTTTLLLKVTSKWNGYLTRTKKKKPDTMVYKVVYRVTMWRQGKNFIFLWSPAYWCLSVCNDNMDCRVFCWNIIVLSPSLMHSYCHVFRMKMIVNTVRNIVVIFNDLIWIQSSFTLIIMFVLWPIFFFVKI